MKQALLTGIALVWSVHILFALPLPNGSTAPNWTATDIDGVEHTLYDYLDQGYTVLIEFSATWCPLCWNFHQNGTFDNLYDTYGPNGSDQVMIFFIEGDPSTPESSLFGGAGSVGNWVDGHDYPFIDDATGSIASDYQAFGFPVLYAICPNRKVYNVGTAPQSQWENWIQSCTLDATSTVTNPDCGGENSGAISISATGGFGNLSYLWDNGETTADRSNLAAGTYSCTVTEGQGHTFELNDIVVSEPTPITVEEMIVLDVSCFGNSDGAATLFAEGGEAPYTYMWSTGATGLTATDLAAGTYTVTIQDALDCETIVDVTVGSPDPLGLSILAQEDVECAGQSTGSATVGATGGNGDYSFEWSNGTMGPTAENLLPGVYTVSVSDQESCMSTLDIEIITSDDNTPPTAIVEDQLIFEIGQADLTPEDIDNGSFDNCGVESLSIDITSFDCDQLGQQTVTLTVTDVNGNTNMAFTTVTVVDTQDPEITCPPNLSTQACAVPVVYALPEVFDNCAGTNLELIEGQASGTVFPEGSTLITYQVSDQSGNTASCSFTISVQNTLDFMVDWVIDSPSDVPEGEIQLAPNGGTSPYTFLWMNAGGDMIGTEMNPENLFPGDYTCVITDANGCQQTLGPITVASTVNTRELFTSDDLQLFPNPAIDKTQLILPADFPTGSVQLQTLDMQGKLIRIQDQLVQPGGQLEIDLSGFEKGVYLIRLVSKNGSWTKRIVVQ
jgi:hypothetical protein